MQLAFPNPLHRMAMTRPQLKVKARARHQRRNPVSLPKSPKAVIGEAGADAAVAVAAVVTAGIVDLSAHRSVVVIGIEIEAGNALLSPVSRGLSKAVLPRGRRRATNPFCCPESRSPNISAGASSRLCRNRSQGKW